MYFDGSHTNRKQQNYGRKSGDDDKRNNHLAIVQQERRNRQLARDKLVAAGKIWQWYKRQRAVHELIRGEQESLFNDISRPEASATTTLRFVQRFLVAHCPLSRDVSHLYTNTNSLFHKTLLSLGSHLIGQLTERIDLACSLLPKQTPRDNAKSVSNQDRLVTVLTLLLRCLGANLASNPKVCVTCLRAIVTATDSATWKLHATVPLPAVRQLMANIASETLKRLSHLQGFYAIMKNCVQSSAASAGAASPRTSRSSAMTDAAMTLMIRASLVAGPTSAEVGFQLLTEVLPIPNLFQLLSDTTKALLLVNSKIIVEATSSCIDPTNFPDRGIPREAGGKDGYDSEDLEDEQDAHQIPMESSAFLFTNLIDLYTALPDLDTERQFKIFEALRTLLRSMRVHPDETPPSILYSPAIIGILFSDILNGAPSKAQLPAVLHKTHIACDIYCILMAKYPTVRTSVLSALAFYRSRKIVMCLWLFLTESNALLYLNRKRYSAKEMSVYLRILLMFCNLYSHMLVVIDDDEFYNTQLPLHLTAVTQLILALKKFVFELYYRNNITSITDDEFYLSVRACKLLYQLHERQIRKPISKEDIWSIAELQNMDPEHIRTKVDIQNLIFLLPFASTFKDRYLFFRELISEDRQYRIMDLFTDSVGVVIRRGHTLEDGYRELAKISTDHWKLNFVIKFTSEDGTVVEEGIDGGGLFKEFLNDLLIEAFAPDFGLFSQTSEGRLYPNSQSIWGHHGIDSFSLLRFIGRMLGKAIYEGIVVDIPFAYFFLKKLQSGMPTIDDLISLDPILHKHLSSLKHYEGDIEDLDLTFSIDEPVGEFGGKVARPFFTGGDSVAVTRQNVQEYIHYMADFKLNKQIRNQTTAFMLGLREVIPTKWWKLFDAKELQILIAGDVTVIDVDDLKRHTRLSGFDEGDWTISYFWQVLKELDDDQRSKFLKFVTSVPRAPMLGFRSLNPPMTVSRMEKADHAPDKYLPNAQTCFNLLKLPAYTTKASLKAKLLLAIQTEAGFGLI